MASWEWKRGRGGSVGHITCLCDNDVRENNPDVVHMFVSDDILESADDDIAFFGIPFREGNKAEIWLCDECGRAIFFDDGGAYVTRIMRAAQPDSFHPEPNAGKPGILYNDERFFDEVADFFDSEMKAGRCPYYEFHCKEYAHGAPLLTPAIVHKRVLSGQVRPFGHWCRARLGRDFLALWENEGDDDRAPSKLWLLSEKDTALVRSGDR